MIERGIVWKVVNRNFESVSAPLVWAKHYALDEWHEAPEELVPYGYGICCFVGRAAAVVFRALIGDPESDRILLCEAEGLWQPQSPWLASCGLEYLLQASHGSTQAARSLYREMTLLDRNEWQSTWPKGTIMARRIKPVRIGG